VGSDSARSAGRPGPLSDQQMPRTPHDHGLPTQDPEEPYLDTD